MSRETVTAHPSAPRERTCRKTRVARRVARHVDARRAARLANPSVYAVRDAIRARHGHRTIDRYELNKPPRRCKIQFARRFFTDVVCLCNITSFYGSSCANNGEGALNTPDVV
eukprot:26276-Pyramimonas_sp.AAC.1